jgi:hypothetical protein
MKAMGTSKPLLLVISDLLLECLGVLFDRLPRLVVLHDQAVPLERPQEAWCQGGEARARVRDQLHGPLAPDDAPAAVRGLAMRLPGGDQAAR